MIEPMTHEGYIVSVLRRRIQGFFRDTTYGNVRRVYAFTNPSPEDFIDYIPAPTVAEIFNNSVPVPYGPWVCPNRTCVHITSTVPNLYP